jgi:hypothetical protein
MASNSPFHAALLAHTYRSLPGGESTGNCPEQCPPDTLPTALQSPDFAQEVETALAWNLNAPAAGKRPQPKKLLPDRTSGGPSPVPAAETESVAIIAPRRLPPATWPAGVETVNRQSRAAPARSVSRYALPNRPAYPGAPASFAGDQCADGEIAASELVDGQTADDLAKRDPVPLASGPGPAVPPRTREPVTAATGSLDASLPGCASHPARAVFAPAPRTVQGERGKVRPIRWQASDATPPGSLLRPSRGGNLTSTAVVVAMVLTGVIGGAGTVVTLESLTAPESAPGVAAAGPTHTRAPDDERSAAAMNPALGKMATAVPVAASGVETILAQDGGNGLAPAEGEPLRSSAKVIPLPQRVPTGVDLRLTSDGDSRDAGDIAVIDSRGVSAPPPGDAALRGVVVDEPVADPVDVTADGGDSLAAPPPRAPTPRPDHGAAPPKGVLAYAPAADSTDRGAKVVAGKDNHEQGAIAPTAWAARIASVSGVNVHAGADGKATIVAVLPAGSIVTVVKCTLWCEILADGKRGFVFKSFLRTIGATST